MLLQYIPQLKFTDCQLGINYCAFVITENNDNTISYDRKCDEPFSTEHGYKVHYSQLPSITFVQWKTMT